LPIKIRQFGKLAVAIGFATLSMTFPVSAESKKMLDNHRSTDQTYFCFKIKNPPPVELCWQKKKIPRINFIFLGCPKIPPKFDIELLSLFT
jgi:hypothetical protein